MIANIHGRFTSYEVTIVASEDPLRSSVTATIDLASVDTGNETRDNHLRSADYFEVEKYPAMSYRSTGIRRTGDGWFVDGECRSPWTSRPSFSGNRHAGGHITPRQAGLAFVPEDGRTPEATPTGADGYARRVAANFLA
jgi:YceI-like protein